MNNWISVKDRLPELEKPVLVYTVWDSYDIVRRRPGSWDGGEDKWCYRDIVYWMPLPDVPIINNEIEVGDKFKNIYGSTFEILSIENGFVNYKACGIGKTFTYGLEAFKRCSLTKLEKEEEL